MTGGLILLYGDWELNPKRVSCDWILQILPRTKTWLRAPQPHGRLSMARARAWGAFCPSPAFLERNSCESSKNSRRRNLWGQIKFQSLSLCIAVTSVFDLKYPLKKKKKVQIHQRKALRKNKFNIQHANLYFQQKCKKHSSQPTECCSEIVSVRGRQ